jgi:hypothetical protein
MQLGKYKLKQIYHDLSKLNDFESFVELVSVEITEYGYTHRIINLDETLKYYTEHDEIMFEEITAIAQLLYLYGLSDTYYVQNRTDTEAAGSGGGETETKGNKLINKIYRNTEKIMENELSINDLNDMLYLTKYIIHTDMHNGSEKSDNNALCSIVELVIDNVDISLDKLGEYFKNNKCTRSNFIEYLSKRIPFTFNLMKIISKMWMNYFGYHTSNTVTVKLNDDINRYYTKFPQEFSSKWYHKIIKKGKESEYNLDKYPRLYISALLTDLTAMGTLNKLKKNKILKLFENSGKNAKNEYYLEYIHFKSLLNPSITVNNTKVIETIFKQYKYKISLEHMKLLLSPLMHKKRDSLAFDLLMNNVIENYELKKEK